ncbi:uncharacterized protein LOC114394852 [Glycine soja]|nr:uncharacterized protein LOC114394852 [Glycine soja]KHN18092.1 hypothetical protein glysoja_020865 [Glycine soja]
MSQSQPERHGNAVSSISNSAISMSKVMEPGAFPLPMKSALPRDPTVHSSTHFHQLPDTKGYLSLPQNRPYNTTINSQLPFSGYTVYNQSPADMKYNLLQNRNEFLINGFPPATARDAFGFGNLGSSIYSSGSFLSNPSPGHMMPSSNFNEILPSQYNDGCNHGSFSHWDFGAEPRSLIIPERTQSQYVTPGYSDLYHSQTRVLEELQQPGDFQDLSSKQMHQFWQHNN